MPAQTRSSVYAQAVSITHAYLGPAAERFIDRQVSNHLHKEAVDMTVEDLQGLIPWIQLTFSALTDDTHDIEDYMRQLELLTQK